MSIDEARLLEKLARVEALFAGATTPGERVAAAEARERIRARLRTFEKTDPPIEYRFGLPDPWERRLFLALARRYGLEPYRLYGQRYSSVMVRVSKRFVDDTLWPEFKELSKTLRTYLDEVTQRVIGEALHQDGSEAREMPRQLQLVGDGGPEEK